MNLTEKSLKILLAVFVMVFSFTVLVQKIPETKYVQKTVERLEESQNTIMKFSGSTMSTSVAISALPDDFGSPLAGTIADLNMYFILISMYLFIHQSLKPFFRSLKDIPVNSDISEAIRKAWVNNASYRKFQNRTYRQKARSQLFSRNPFVSCRL